MSGKLTDENKEAIIGAIIQAVHQPSGTRYSTSTNEDGRFLIQGMRPGGPYEVNIRYMGFKPKSIKNINLELAETYNMNIVINEDAKEMDELVVVGSSSKFAGEKTGASTNISNEQLESMPTISRSITDITRLSPYGGNGMNFAGVDGRTANFTVDGANFNNNFGLSDGLPGGGNPISIDAIEELQVVISPFDVRQTNFIGGGINAITKSGTNTFKGTALCITTTRTCAAMPFMTRQLPVHATETAAPHMALPSVVPSSRTSCSSSQMPSIPHLLL